MYIMNAAGTVDHDNIDLVKDQYDVIVTKSLTKEPKAGNPKPHWKRLEHGYINSVGMRNPGFKNYTRWDVGKLLIVSIGGNFEAACEYFDDKDILGLELNLSCPNIEGNYHVASIVSRCRQLTSHTIGVKLGIENYLRNAQDAVFEGANKLTLINTIPAYDSEFGYGGLSGKAIKPVALRAVSEVSKVVDVPIIGCGGIYTPTDIEEFTKAGATDVQIGSKNLG